ncbi:putative diguanylate cyclase YdaM [Grimontia celer]|uniref:diguanylate cyclase n=1 Tax=Grimontia celer TaxID=1796497 RepID=A0A128EVW1_9GAMM|nr:diguanylate cyclase [Grimontia celer]CZF78330.1 putative diguanylate cyclase YdaM [Grimontia celer]
MKLHTKAVISIAIFCLLTVVPMVVMKRLSDSALIESEHLSVLAKESSEFAHHFQAVINTETEIGQLLATNHYLIHVLRDANTPPNKQSEINKKAASDFLIHFSKNIRAGVYQEILVSDKHGNIVAQTIQRDSDSVKQEPWWQKALNGEHSLIFTSPKFHSNTDYILGITQPIKQEGATIGALRLNLNLSQTFRHHEGFFDNLHDGVNALLMNHNGEVYFAKSPIGREYYLEILEAFDNGIINGTNTTKLPNHLVGMTTLKLANHAKDDHSNTASANYFSAPHIFVVSEPITLINHFQNENNLGFVLYSALFITVAFIVIVGLLRQTGNDISTLTNVAFRIGQGDLDARSDINRSDELGVLAKTINEMASELGASQTLEKELKQHVTDITRSNAKFRSLASVDELTHLLNRRAFNEHIDAQINRFKRYNEPFSVILFDIDHFKRVNDEAGHFTGDEILKRIAYLIRNLLRSEDVFCRWGGEEFIALLPHTHGSDAVCLAERMRLEVAKDNFDGFPHVTISLGVTEFEKGDDEKTVVTRVDTAMYRSKNQGRNRTSTFYRDANIRDIESPN